MAISCWLFALAVLILWRLNCMCSFEFPIWSLGQDLEFDCIGSYIISCILVNILTKNHCKVFNETFSIYLKYDFLSINKVFR